MKAAIDIGTNTVLLLIAEVKGDQLRVIHEGHHTPRLGKGVDNEKNINREATERVLDALRDYRGILETNYPSVEQVTVTATSAVRDANNRAEFMSTVKEETGFNIRLLTGKEEAEWTATGALSVLPIATTDDILIMDIGGGSTEVAHLKDGDLADGFSFDMGCVRFTERFLASNPPSANEIIACRKAISELYDSHRFDVSENVMAVGVAGTLTTLAGMNLGLDAYSPDQINGFIVTPEILSNTIEKFSNVRHEEMLERYPIYLKGRADIFLAGLLILEGFMNKHELSEMQVSTGGIRHGAILKAQKKAPFNMNDA